MTPAHTTTAPEDSCADLTEDTAGESDSEAECATQPEEGTTTPRCGPLRTLEGAPGRAVDRAMVRSGDPAGSGQSVRSVQWPGPVGPVRRQVRKFGPVRSGRSRNNPPDQAQSA